MSNAKIISSFTEDLRTALEVVEDEINLVRINFQQQINELKQRVRSLEEAGVTPEASA